MCACVGLPIEYNRANLCCSVILHAVHLPDTCTYTMSVPEAMSLTCTSHV